MEVTGSNSCRSLRLGVEDHGLGAVEDRHGHGCNDRHGVEVIHRRGPGYRGGQGQEVPTVERAVEVIG